DQRAFLVGDPRPDEPFDRPTPLKHAERGVPCARDLPGLIHDPLEHRRAIELRRQRHARGVERAEANRLLAVTRLQGGEASEQNGGEAEHACDANSEHHEVGESRGHRRLEDEIVDTDERDNQNGGEDKGGKAQARRQRGPRLRSVRQASDYRRASAERSGSLRSSLYAMSCDVAARHASCGTSGWLAFVSVFGACQGVPRSGSRKRSSPRYPAVFQARMSTTARMSRTGLLLALPASMKFMFMKAPATAAMAMRVSEKRNFAMGGSAMIR